MKRLLLPFLLCLLFSNVSNCQFSKRAEWINHRSDTILNIFKSDLTSKERDYLEFLYSYMPLSDIADYDGDFFLKQVKSSIKARDFFTWGKNIPEDIFKHFVLVYRVNNENLDTARLVFFDKIKDRIKNMTMYEAVLEVNHWCHEYVNYKAADGRTSAPLSTLRTSHGRCGEESTFTVTALRAVGIPARQCYTPRWAHTDDNHAWVEVWVDGKWYFLGACEPEPELNIAWFTAPAKRAMMVHSTVFGRYKEIEEVNHETELYTKINLLSNYTPTQKIYVLVRDKANNLVGDANVAFGLYNYAEYYPIADRKTDNNGITYLTTGLGDLMIWANKGNDYAYKKISVSKVDTIFLTLQPNKNKEFEELLEITPPISRSVASIESGKGEINSKRLLFEDSIRNAYIASFPNEKDIIDLSKRLPNFDSKDIENVIKRSIGNYKEIENFLLSNSDKQEAIQILKVIFDKDLRDTPAKILQSHLDAFLNTIQNNKIANYPQDILLNNILNPRIQLEIITTWRESIPLILKNEVFRTPEDIAIWINNNININNSDNYYGCQISPLGVLRLREADNVSREILFVAIARTYGFAAKYDWATNKAQFYSDGKWITALLEKTSQIKEFCKLRVHNSSSTNKIKPEYYTHFTIARFNNGRFVTLDYEYDPKFQIFPEELDLESGYYRLMTGNRANDGSVFVKTNYFELKPGTISDIFVEIREIDKKIDIYGSVSMNTKVQLNNGLKINFDSISNNKELVIAILDPQREPTRHVMVDLPLLKSEFENWGGGILFLVPDDKISSDFSENKYNNLPKQSIFAVDKDRKILNQIIKETKLDFKNNFPLLLLITKKGEIVYLSEGYIIGVGENLIKTIRQVEGI